MPKNTEHRIEKWNINTEKIFYLFGWLLCMCVCFFLCSGNWKFDRYYIMSNIALAVCRLLIEPNVFVCLYVKP